MQNIYDKMYESYNLTMSYSLKKPYFLIIPSIRSFFPLVEILQLVMRKRH